MFFILVYVHLLILFTNPLRSGRIWHKVNFQVEFNRFEFRVFLLLDKLPHQGWRIQFVLLFTHSWRENNWIHTFPKCYVKCNQSPLGFELVSPCPFPTTITITRRYLCLFANTISKFHPVDRMFIVIFFPSCLCIFTKEIAGVNQKFCNILVT